MERESNADRLACERWSKKLEKIKEMAEEWRLRYEYWSEEAIKIADHVNEAQRAEVKKLERKLQPGGHLFQVINGSKGIE